MRSMADRITANGVPGLPCLRECTIAQSLIPGSNERPNLSTWANMRAANRLAIANLLALCRHAC